MFVFLEREQEVENEIFLSYIFRFIVFSTYTYTSKLLIKVILKYYSFHFSFFISNIQVPTLKPLKCFFFQFHSALAYFGEPYISYAH